MEDHSAYNVQEIPDSAPSMWKHALSYGLYYALLSIVIMVVAYITGTLTAKPLQYISNVVLIAAVVVIQLHYRKILGGFISYGQSIGIAVLSMLVAAVPVAVYTWCLYKFIDPGLLDQLKLIAEEKLVNMGLSEEMISANMAFSSKFISPSFLSISQLFNLPLTALIIGLISSIFIKKQSPDRIFE